MIFGMTPFTFFHVLISLIGIGSGFIVVFGMIAGKRLDSWNAIFLITTVLTSVTGFFFPYRGFKPSYLLGILSLIALAIAIPALYTKHLVGPWRRTFVIASVIALYFNVFVLRPSLREGPGPACLGAHPIRGAI
jgi:hypothetical protein